MQTAARDGVWAVFRVREHAGGLREAGARHHDRAAMQPFVQNAQHLARWRFYRLYLVDTDDHRLILPPARVLGDAQHLGDGQIGGGGVVPIELADADQRQRPCSTLLADDAESVASAYRHGGRDEEHQALGVLGDVSGGHRQVQHIASAGLLAFDELA